jgi:hypothetical protein
VLNLAAAHPLPLLFFPIVLDIVIVRNAEGQPKEQGGCDCPGHLKYSTGQQPHREEQIKVIIVPPALPPMVPSATVRAKKKREKATALVAPAAASDNASTATLMPSTAPAKKKGK